MEDISSYESFGSDDGVGKACNQLQPVRKTSNKPPNTDDPPSVGDIYKLPPTEPEVEVVNIDSQTAKD